MIQMKTMKAKSLDLCDNDTVKWEHDGKRYCIHIQQDNDVLMCTLLLAGLYVDIQQLLVTALWQQLSLNSKLSVGWYLGVIIEVV